jgi:hypothetical protein
MAAIGQMHKRDLISYGESLGLVMDNTLDRAALVALVVQKEKEIEELRLQAVDLGLPSTGTEGELRVRIAEARAAIKPSDRHLYRMVGWGSVFLGFAVLAVSLPHLAHEIKETTGQLLVFGYLLAFSIDLGAALLKVAEILSKKFDFGGQKTYLRLGLIACLAVSALLNAVGFVREGSQSGVAIGFAVFLSGAVYGFWSLAGYMLTNCAQAPEEPEEPQEDDPASKAARLRHAADEIERLCGVAGKV